MEVSPPARPGKRSVVSVDADRLQLFGTGHSYPAVADYVDVDGNYFMPNIPPAAAVDVASTLAILDTGVLLSHPLIAPRLEGSFDLTGEGADDLDGHGTAVALLAILAAPSLCLQSIKVYAQDAPFEEDVRRIAEGVRLAVERKATAINLCVGDARPCGEKHKAMCEAVGFAIDNGVGVAVAGGARCPAECDDRVISIGESGQPRDDRAPPGLTPDIEAPSPGRVEFVPWHKWRNEYAYETGKGC